MRADQSVSELVGGEKGMMMGVNGCSADASQHEEAFDRRGVEVVVTRATESPCQVVDICAYNAMGWNGKGGRQQPARRGCVTMRYVSWWYRGNIYTPCREDSRSEVR